MINWLRKQSGSISMDERRETSTDNAVDGRGYRGRRDRDGERGRGRFERERVLAIGKPEWLAFVSRLLPDFELVGVQAGDTSWESLRSRMDQRYEGRGGNWRLCICEVELKTQDGQAEMKKIIKEVRRTSLRTFIAVWSPDAAESATARLALHELGANMVTQCPNSLTQAAMLVTKPEGNGMLECVTCGLGNLTEDELWEHYPLFHVNHELVSCQCRICNSRARNFAVHLQNDHGPPGRGEMHSESTGRSTQLFSFALVVCRHPDGRFLLVQEFANQGFWLPGGAVDPEESLRGAAVRETKEEAGLDVELTGVIKIEHTAHDGYVRLRVIFAAVPKFAAQLPKSMPDYESVGAAWVPFDEIKEIKLRGSEPLKFCGHVHFGKPVYPLDVLEDRGR